MRTRVGLEFSLCAVAILTTFVSVLLATASPLLQPTAIDSRTLSSFLLRLGYRDYTQNVRRNSSGSRVYAYQWSKDGLGVLVIEHGRVVQRLTRPAETAYLNDEGQFVAWSDDFKTGVSFRGGARSILPRLTSFGVDPGGRYFFVRPAESPVEIGRVSNPQEILATSELAVPQAIFAGDKKIYLVGRASKERSPITCETYEIRSDKASFRDAQIIQDASVVLDMDTMDERLIVQSSRDFLPSARVVQLRGSADTRLGLAKNFALFLQPGVLP